MKRYLPHGKHADTSLPVRGTVDERSFAEVVDMIRASRGQALAAVNTALAELYWRIGEYISCKLETAAWGEGVVDELARYIQLRQPNVRGFTRRNLFRMRQFYEAYRGDKKVSALLTQLPWTHHLLILSAAKRPEEREFYIRLALQEKWSSRDLERQLTGGLFERAVLNPPKISAALKEIHPGAEVVFRDAYFVEFLDLPDGHHEADLHSGLVQNMRRFLTELGRDFCFIGSEVPLQVGGKDFLLDLLFFHRELACLVAIELKVGEFMPEHLGKLEFYLEALDRDVRKPHERPSIGVLLCASKDNEVVEYALSRSLSPTLISEYQTRLPDRKLLQAKLHEFYELTESVTLANPHCDATATTSKQRTRVESRRPDRPVGKSRKGGRR
jgi:predicted nuclease of restriction endonuclease-like (RecB) superfamily